MKIVHVISGIDPRGGGPAEALRGLSSAQSMAGLSVRALATFNTGDDLSLADQLRPRGVEVRLVGPCRRPFTSHPDLARVAGEEVAEADVVHIHALWEDVQHLAAKFARRLGRPYIIRPCGMLDPWSLRQSWLKKQAYLFFRLRAHLQHASALHYTTTIERDRAGQLRLKAPSLVETNGITVADFDDPPPRGTLRQRLGIDASDPVVLFLGRVHYKKGLDILIPAFAQMQPPARLWIAGTGDPEYVARLESDCARLGIANRVRFLGMLRGVEKQRAFRDADLFALPSHQENFGIAVAEAMASGLPVIISDQVNINPEVTAAGAGEVLPLAIEAWVSALDRWLSDAPRRMQASQRAAQLARERYDWNAIALRWVKHYERLCQR